MKDGDVWPPAPKNQPAPLDPTPGWFLFVKVPLLALVLGVILGFWDITRTDNFVDWVTFGAALLLGFLQPKTFPLSAFLLAFCLYLMHLLAIQQGLKTPYVEPNSNLALNCWYSVFPNALGAGIGALVKTFLEYEPMGPQK